MPKKAKLTAKLDLDALKGLNHQHGVAANDAHAHGVGGGVLAVLDRVIDDQVHKGVEPAEHALDFSA